MWRGALVRCLFLLAMGGWTTQVHSQTIEFGLAAPLSGPTAALGNQVRRGAEVAIEDINAKGGVFGRKLVLKIADDGCVPAKAVEAARRLIQLDKVAAVIGHVCAPASSAAAEVYAQARVVMMSPAPVDARLSEAVAKNGWRNIFMLGGSVQSQGFAAGTYLARRYKDKGIALIIDQSIYGADLASGFKHALADRSTPIAFETVLTGNVVDVVPALDRIRAIKPVAVYLAATTANAAVLVKHAKEAGLDTTFVAGNAVGRPEFLRIAEGFSEGVLSTTVADVQALPSAREAVAQLRARGFDAERYTLYAYAAVQVLAQAIGRAGSAELDQLEPVLRQQSFPTAIGNVRFGKPGDRDVSEISFAQWHNGKLVPFDTSEQWVVARDVIAMTAIRGPAFSLPGLSLDGLPDFNTVAPAIEAVPGSGARRPAAANGAATRASRPVLIDDSGGDRATIEAKALQGVFWNTYFTRDGESDSTLSTKSQSAYRLVLDLSAYNYRQIKQTNAAGTAVDPKVKNTLEQASTEPLQLKIRPVMVTPLLTIEGGQPPVQIMSVTRSKLLRPQQGTAADEENRMVGRFKVGALPLEEFAKQVFAGQVTFNVRVSDAAMPGCAVIAFTIWDYRDNPIDYLLQTVPVGDGTALPKCEQTSPEALKGGFATLMSPVFSIGAADAPQPIQAALHLFEIMAAGQQKTIAIFIDKTKYQAAVPGQPGSEQGIYGWRTSRWLSDYVGKPNAMPARIYAAWPDAQKGTAGPYAGVADELAGWIFGADAVDQPRANAAREALKKLAESQDAPVVVVRAVDESNRKFYVPFNLISAEGNIKGITRPITVVQPLQTERYEAPSCISSWTFGLSQDTNLLDANTKRDFAEFAAAQPPTGEKWLRDAADLSNYFELPPPNTAAGTPATPVPAEGLVLLAHHDGVGVYFDNVKGRVSTFGHSYPRGSIALLAACTAAQPNAGMDILNGLNQNGIDAMIVSPFNVRLDYGSRMALEFAKVARDSRENARTPTLAEMFAQATAATRQYFKSRDPNTKLDEMALEFIMVGNPYLKMCAP